jgi:riboflavin kinase/FMN adenylyltransferase
LYGRHLALHLVQRLRGERKFAGVDELRGQITRDVALARSVLSLPEAKA